MSADPPAHASRAIDAILRQTSDLRRLCVSLREARQRGQEARLAAEFDRAISAAAARMNIAAIRAGFKNLWKEGRYDRIAAVGRLLSKDLLEGDETALMYYACALARQPEGASLPGDSA